GRTPPDPAPYPPTPPVPARMRTPGPAGTDHLPRSQGGHRSRHNAPTTVRKMRAPNGTRPATLLTTIADELNIDSREAVLVRHHGTQVWHLPSSEAIVRIPPAH